MTFHIITIFPKIFDSYFNEGIIKRARELKGLLKIDIYDLRDYTTDNHKTVDDNPFGGGPGMVLKVEPIYKAVEDIKSKIVAEETDLKQEEVKTILFSAKGNRYTQTTAKRLAKLKHIILICGRYEGVDERVAEYIADEEISVGDFVLTGGELPAMTLVDSVIRLVPDVLGNPDSLISESFNGEELLEDSDYPVYTRPEVFRGWEVPEVLRGGNHKEIDAWRNTHRAHKPSK